MDDHNVRRQFRVITEAAGLGRACVPRELRQTFACRCCRARRAGGGDRAARGTPTGTATTELVYRHQIVPALNSRRRSHGSDLRLAGGPLGGHGNPRCAASLFAAYGPSATTSARCHLMITDGVPNLAVRSAACTAMLEGKPSRSAGRAARKWRASGRRTPHRWPGALVMVSGRRRHRAVRASACETPSRVAGSGSAERSGGCCGSRACRSRWRCRGG